ncbi:hypothetical protein PG997_000115 [Apiospora hydei]|uniref:Uncharacterized protein n=1 Tax=Apiospora hydei TaxID=1337664 RepID=A0ABR1X9T3_9PEZI
MDPQVHFLPTDALNKDRLARQPSAQTLPSIEQNPPESIAHVPGDPAVGLGHNDVGAHLSKHLRTPVLDELYEKLWLVARKSGESIDPLHTQKVKGRAIMPTEDPNLHLVWDRDKIYIKPVPLFLLNYDFWLTYLQEPEQHPSSRVPQEPSQIQLPISDRSIATGFLRSYALLIPNRLDFALAQESHLIPPGINWLEWSKFTTHFRRKLDNEVAKRYHYGQLRLSRLHWAVRIFRPRNTSTSWFYANPYWSITELVERATVPLLFIFASISLVLSSMQVILSVPVDDLWYKDSAKLILREASRAFWVFSIGVVLFGGIVWVFILGIPLIILLGQLAWAIRHRDKGPNIQAPSV